MTDAEVKAALNGALACHQSGDLGGAEQIYRRLIAAHPDSYDAHNNLAVTLHKIGRIEEAIESYRRALALDPRRGAAYGNLAAALLRLNQVGAAVENGEKAVELAPDSPDAHYNLGNFYRAAARVDDAIASYEQAIALQPGNAGFRWNRALALLLASRFAQGWEAYESRWRGNPFAPPKRYDFTPWAGERTAGKRLLLWGEQGIGDEIIFASLFDELNDTGMQITLETDPRLVSLMQRSFPRLRVVARNDPPSLKRADFDSQCPLPSLGRWLRPDAASFPRHPGYLKPDPARVNALSSRLRGPGAGRVVGISWRSTQPEYGADKTTALADWAEVLKTPGIRFADLQYGDTRADREALNRAGVEIAHLDDVDLYNDLEGLAALCASCDLVVTVSNITAHVAGALGKPVWVLVPQGRARIWYWHFGERSPWYPSMRLYPQERLGSWREPLVHIAQELARSSC